jgi:hypothetical protein
MKQTLLITMALLSSGAAYAQDNGEETAGSPYQSAWRLYQNVTPGDVTLSFNMQDEGVSMPILWGFDTAWNDYANMLRGVRHSGSESVGVVRVSFQPWAGISEKGVLPPMLQQNLEKRLETVSLVGKKVDIALNLDGGEPTVKSIYGGLDADGNYVGDPDAVADAYALLIDATAAAVERAGYRVVSAAPFNEPDYYWNGTPINVFGKINERLKNFDEYPRFRDIRLSGGNTLNCDEALPWYETLKDNLDEGNTHQLAGDFNHYADFFATVRADGKYATADELHNVMEAMVGVEYGMQTGIWWGSAEQARGEFMKASFGKRLGYAENRKAWSAASVYRSPSGKIQAFLGCSERQALPSTFNIVSRSGDMFVDGYGPVREYIASLPGDPNGGYMTELQRNAETMLPISNGEDVQPYISGSYILVNAASRMAVSGQGGATANGTQIVQNGYSGGADQLWTVGKVPETQGGDFSYYFIRNTADGQALDDNNWNLETGGIVIAYAFSSAAVQQWALEYDGDGWFHIRNKQSALYLESDGTGAGAAILQQERSDSDSQKWRFIPAGAEVEFDAPATPQGLTASSRTAAVVLEWNAVADASDVTYNVVRAGEDGNFSTIARGLKEPGFIDNGVISGKPYSYKVMAEDSSGNRSEYSAQVTGGTEGEALIAHFPLNGTVDCEGGNDFSLRTAESPSFRGSYREGVTSLYMKGNQYVQLPYSVMQNDRLTFAAWAYAGSYTEDMRILSTGIDETESLTLTPSVGGCIRLMARNGEYTAMLTAPASPVKTWTHYAVTVDGTYVKLYVNGECMSEVDFGNALPTDRILTYVGRHLEPTPTYFVGNIGDVRIYNYPLDEEGVRNAMNGTDSGVESTVADSTAVRTEYYTPQGVRIDAPAEKGVTITRSVYSDGRVRTGKIIR